MNNNRKTIPKHRNFDNSGISSQNQYLFGEPQLIAGESTFKNPNKDTKQYRKWEDLTNGSRS